MNVSIREATGEDVALLTRLIRDSFRDVAARFALTPENCPTHPSNCTEDKVARVMEKNATHYVLECDGTPAGCVAMERTGQDFCYLETLSVLPEFRRKGFGDALVEHVRARARELGLDRIEVAIIAQHSELRQWYEKRGFRAVEMRRFDHLPFLVLFMSGPA